MHPAHVFVQITALSRPDFTKQTLVGPLTEVCDGVVATQGAPTGERLLAERTRV